MITTHIVGEYTNSDSVVEISFVNGDGHLHDRVICLPKNEDDTVNEEALSQVVKDLLKSVKDRESMGLLGFRDPDAVDTLAGDLPDVPEEEEVAEEG